MAVRRLSAWQMTMLGMVESCSSKKSFYSYLRHEKFKTFVEIVYVRGRSNTVDIVAYLRVQGHTIEPSSCSLSFTVYLSQLFPVSKEWGFGWTYRLTCSAATTLPP